MFDFSKINKFKKSHYIDDNALIEKFNQLGKISIKNEVEISFSRIGYLGKNKSNYKLLGYREFYYFIAASNNEPMFFMYEEPDDPIFEKILPTNFEEIDELIKKYPYVEVFINKFLEENIVSSKNKSSFKTFRSMKKYDDGLLDMMRKIDEINAGKI